MYIMYYMRLARYNIVIGITVNMHLAFGSATKAIANATFFTIAYEHFCTNLFFHYMHISLFVYFFTIFV